MLLIIIAVLLKGGGDKEEKTGEDQSVQDVTAGEQGTEEEGEETEQPAAEPENKLEENSHASIDRLVSKYCECIASGDVDTLESIVDVISEEDKERVRSRAAMISSMENITCYTKDGPEEDSYIVFVCYDMKLKDVETLAPDINCLYVGPNGDEGRRIHYGTIDESIQAYVDQLAEDPEVKALYDDVSARYQEALESDEMLANFIDRINGQVSQEEPEAPAEEEPAETEEPEAPAEEEPEAPSEGAATAQNRQTRVSSTVNVRSEATTESERIAVAYQGDTITQIESYDNGWSKVEYKGQTGYVMTEYLE